MGLNQSIFWSRHNRYVLHRILEWVARCIHVLGFLFYTPFRVYFDLYKEIQVISLFIYVAVQFSTIIEIRICITIM
jgi:hypothetical protein